jgi:hypothetical protein
MATSTNAGRRGCEEHGCGIMSAAGRLPERRCKNSPWTAYFVCKGVMSFLTITCPQDVMSCGHFSPEATYCPIHHLASPANAC